MNGINKRIIFLGSSGALKPKIILESIIESNLLHDRELIFFTESEEGVSIDYCKENGIKFIVFPNINLNDINSFKIVSEYKNDILISVGWPHKIPYDFLRLFEITPINCHGSILPDYRGSRSYMHYWANIEEYYGASIHYMNENFDDGNVIIQGRLKLFKEETPAILHRRTAELCAYLIPSAINMIEENNLGFEKEGLKRYFKKLSHEDFLKYREFNESRKPNERKLTPHKIINS